MNYLDYKRDFLSRHNFDFSCDTSPMDANGQYVKTYLCKDGAVLTEVNRPVYRSKNVEVVIEGITIKQEITIKLFETEAWNTDNADSVKFYEKF